MRKKDRELMDANLKAITRDTSDRIGALSDRINSIASRMNPRTDVSPADLFVVERKVNLLIDRLGLEYKEIKAHGELVEKTDEPDIDPT